MHAGTWYAGVEGDDHNDCTYTITINKFDCPLNCSGRGTCIHKDNGTRTCQCDEVWSFTSWFLQKTRCLLHHGNLQGHVGKSIRIEQANDCFVVCNSTFDTAEGGFCWQKCVGSTHIQSADATRLSMFNQCLSSLFACGKYHLLTQGKPPLCTACCDNHHAGDYLWSFAPYRHQAEFQKHVLLLWLEHAHSRGKQANKQHPVIMSPM